MLSRILATALSVAVLLLSGCATPTKMAFSDDPATLQTTSKPIFLMTATVRNTYKTSFQPKMIVVNVERAVVKGTADRINFTMDDKAKNESDSSEAGSSYLMRMELEQGEYVIRGLTGMAKSFPIFASFFVPLHANVKSGQPGVFYLGHVEATVRERKGEEFKAGPSVPLIDSAVAGASTGSFDIEISDQWDTDQPKFLAKFPALTKITVQKAILPPFDRAVAQKWWEAN